MSGYMVQNQHPSTTLQDDEDYPFFSLKDISFEDNLREMMFGFGDKLEPYSGTVKLMDELVKDFMTDLSLRSMDIAKRCNKTFDCESIQWAVRPREDYFQRLQELLSSFDSISSQTRYETSDLDTSAKARKQAYKAQDKEAKKRMKMNDQSGVDV